MPNQPDPGALGGLPRFQDVDPGELPPLTDEETSPGPEAPPTTSEPPRHPPTGSAPPSTSTSSTTSSDAEPAGPRHELPEGVENGLEELATGAAHLAGIALNKLAQRRTRTETRLWLMTEDEARGIAGPLARMAARRAPEELVEGDGADLFEAGGHALGYGLRNVMGVDDVELERRANGAPPTPRPAPEPPPPPPDRGVAPTDAQTLQNEPAPPSVLEGL